MNEEYSPQMLFFVHAQTILEVIGIFAQFHCLSSYRNDFVLERPVTDEKPGKPYPFNSILFS